MKDKDFRELQVSSSQLVVIFLAILILGLIVFLLGVSVGKKQTEIVLQASGGAPAVKEKIEVIKPDIPGPAKETGEAENKEIKPGATRPTDVLAAQEKRTQAQTELASKAQSKPDLKTRETIGQPKEPAKTPPSKTKPIETATAAGSKPAVEKTGVKAAPAEASKTTIYYVQVGAFKTREQGQAMAERFEKDGYPVVVMTPAPQDKNPFFRVRIGGYLTRPEAEDVRARLRLASRKGEEYIIVRIE